MRFIQGNFLEKYDPTIEDSYRKLVEVDGSACMLDIMDTAGQEEYSALRDQYMKTGQGFLLVYSVTTQASFEAVTRLRTQVLRIKEDQPQIPIVLVGNKVDMEEERAVSTDSGKNLAEKWGNNTVFVETSAKSNINVTECFVELVRLINRWRESHPEFFEDNSRRKRRGLCTLL